MSYISGFCLNTVCDPGYYGSTCNQTCPENCALHPDTGTAYCDFVYGNCTYGCKDGHWGENCGMGCSVNCHSSPAGTELGKAISVVKFSEPF